MPFYSLCYESFREFSTACPSRLSYIFGLAAPNTPLNPTALLLLPFYLGQAVYLYFGLTKTRVILFHLLKWPAI